MCLHLRNRNYVTTDITISLVVYVPFSMILVSFKLQ